MTSTISPEPTPTDNRSAAAAIDVAAMLRRIDPPAIIAAWVEQAARTMPALSSLPDNVLRGPLTDVAGSAAGRVVRAMLENRALSEDEIGDSAERFAEVMAVWGLTIDDIAEMFAQGAQLFWRAAARHTTPDQLRAFLHSAGRGLDSAALVERIARLSAGHVDVLRVAAERTARAALASTVDAPPRALSPTSARLFVALRPGAGLREQAALATRLRELGLTAMTSSDHVIGSLTTGTDAPEIADAILVVEAQPRPGSSNDRTRRLHELLTVAARHGRRGLLTDLDLAPERLLAAAPPVARRLRALVAAIDSAPFGAQLSATARAFVAADGAVGETARALALHRESVRHRIGRIQQLTGLDLGSWHGRCLLSLALRAASDDDGSTRPTTGTATTPETPSAVEDGTSALRAILDRVDRTELVRDIVERRRADHPELTATLAATGVEVESVEADLDVVLALLRSRPSRDHDLVGAYRRTLEYLSLGATADEIVAIGRTTPQIVWGAILDGATDDELRPLSATIDRLIVYINATQVALTYAATVNQPSAEAVLVHVLLAPEASDQTVVAAATAAGLTITTPRRGLVIVLDPASAVPAGRVAMDLRGVGWATIVRDERIYGIAPLDAAEARLDEHLPPNAVAALGDGTALREIGRELRHLERLVDLAAADGRTGLLDLVASTFESLLLGQPDIARAYREAIVAPLERRDPVLVTTLRRYVDHGFQRGPSAAALHLHPNSLDYRLGIIKHEIGRTFATIDDVMAVLLGATADRLEASSPR